MFSRWDSVYDPCKWENIHVLWIIWTVLERWWHFLVGQSFDQWEIFLSVASRPLRDPFCLSYHSSLSWPFINMVSHVTDKNLEKAKNSKIFLLSDSTLYMDATATSFNSKPARPVRSYCDICEVFDRVIFDFDSLWRHKWSNRTKIKPSFLAWYWRLSNPRQ